MITLEDKILKRGFKTLANGWGVKKNLSERLETWIEEDPDFLEEQLGNMNSKVFGLVFDSFVKHKSDRLSKDIWRHKYKNIVKDPGWTELSSFAIKGAWNADTALVRLYFNIIKMQKKNGDLSITWKELYDKISPHAMAPHTSDYIVNAVIPKLCGEFFRENPQEAKTVMYDVAFKKKKVCQRKALYMSYIDAGLLDKKIARRIRSDGSEYTSVAAIKYFLTRLDLYKNPKIILTQFVDIRHHGAQEALANKAPDYMIPFMMGFESYYAKKTLEKRSAKISKDKMEKQNDG